MTRLNTQFSVKGISWIQLNSVMASSSSVQFKKFLFNQVDDIAGNEVSPTKQARGDSGKEPKLHWWQNGEKNLGRNQAQSGGHFSLMLSIGYRYSTWINEVTLILSGSLFDPLTLALSILILFFKKKKLAPFRLALYSFTKNKTN